MVSDLILPGRYTAAHFVLALYRVMQYGRTADIPPTLVKEMYDAGMRAAASAYMQ